MDHQDWKPVILNSNGKKKEADKQEKDKKLSEYTPPPETIKIETPKSLGQLICQARTAKGKTQKQLSAELGISTSVLSRWETNKESLNNNQIAKIEKILGVKLPRSKRVKVEENR